MSSHIVFATPPAPGHVYPTLPLVEQLVARGHRVSYVTSPTLGPMVTAAGAAALDLDWEPDTSGLSDSDFSAEVLAASLNEYLTAARSALPSIVERFQRDVLDLICYDAVILGPLLASLFDAPLVSLLPTFASNEHFTLTQLVPGFDPAHPALVEYGARAGTLLAEYGLPTISMGGEPGSNLTLVFLPREFQIAGHTFDQTYQFIGPSVGTQARASDWQPAGDGPVLLVSLGTAFNNRPEFFAACAQAFRDSHWQVVMAIGKHIDPTVIGPVPANVEIAAEVPQLAVLRHAKAFVTHAGMGSTMESLHYQVPLIAVPQVHEQAVTARRVQELGLGRCLAAPTPDQLRDTVEQVAADPSIRANLAIMKRALCKAGGASAGLAAIEKYLHAQPKCPGQTP